MRAVLITTLCLIGFCAVANAGDDTNFDPNSVVNPSGSTGVGRHDPSPTDPGVMNSGGPSSSGNKSTITSRDWGDDPGPDTNSTVVPAR